METFMSILSGVAVFAVWMAAFSKHNSILQIGLLAVHFVLSILLIFWFINVDNIPVAIVWGLNALLGGLLFGFKLTVKGS